MNAIKKLGKAVAYVYAFIILMLLGLVLLTNAMIHTLS